MFKSKMSEARNSGKNCKNCTNELKVTPRVRLSPLFQSYSIVFSLIFQPYFTAFHMYSSLIQLSFNCISLLLINHLPSFTCRFYHTVNARRLQSHCGVVKIILIGLEKTKKLQNNFNTAPWIT